MDRDKIYWTMVSIDLIPNGTPQGERKHLGDRIWLGRSDEL